MAWDLQSKQGAPAGILAGCKVLNESRPQQQARQQVHAFPAKPAMHARNQRAVCGFSCPWLPFILQGWLARLARRLGTAAEASGPAHSRPV